MITLNKAHATHVCSQVENMFTALHHFGTILKDSQVNQDKFVTENIFLQLYIVKPSEESEYD